MIIRRAQNNDIEGIGKLLLQVHRVHSSGRPDIFRVGSRKYNDSELELIIKNDKTPIFVAVNDEDTVLGYAFCVYEEIRDDKSLMDRKSLYIDDLCVDENQRGKHIGTHIYEYVLEEARKNGCYHITLNVWTLNQSAMKFYEKCGMEPLKITMEKRI
ncbi:MAG: GNAT family N-acetyltransferase [Clostridia bacterium]|nr:GNAT family N-acetyltransferase [Clostridia bacterium]MEE1185746.1 GNAT family N-acetyltransferase [Acutalibacteraceae bacterium]